MGLGELADLVDGAYAAALDDTRWTAWADVVRQRLGGIGAAFCVLDARGPTAGRFVPLGRAERGTADYFAGMAAADPQVPMAASLFRSTIYLDTDHVDESRPETADYCRWQRSLGFDHHMTALTPLDGGRVRVGLSIHQSVDAGPTPLIEQEKLRAIFPDVARAWSLAFRHGEMLQDAFWTGLVAREDGRAAILIDEGGRVLRATEAATALISTGDGMTIRGGQLGAIGDADDSRLAAVIGRALMPVGAGAGATRVARPSGRASLIVTAYPLARSRRMLAPVEAAALVVVVDPTLAQEAPAALLRTAFGLTAREADLVTLLAKGHSIESSAARLAITMPTARLHLRHIFAKTGTGRQSELVRLLGRLA